MVLELYWKISKFKKEWCILENIINLSQQETKELLKIDINNFEQNKVFYSQKNIQISPDFKASIKKIKKSLAKKN